MDDDADDRFLFTEALHEIDKQIELHTLANGHELLHEITSAALPPSIIFLDVNMPGYNGFECLTHIRENHSFNDVNVYLFSTSSTAKNIETAESMGATGYFMKPTNYADLKALITDCLQSVENVQSK